MVLSPSLPVRAAPLPRVPTRPAPNLRRVAAWSTALVLHATVLAIALAPRLPLTLPAAPPPAPPLVVEEVERVVVAPVPAPPEPQRTVEPVPVPPVASAPVPAPVGIEPAALAPQRPTIAPQPPRFDPDPPPFAARGQTQAIAVASVTPPPYPGLAARRGDQGTVVLRVLIGADGTPRAVEVERGSGSRVLDRAAREHVLAAWRFHPALRDGQPVAAWARVPIEFSLQ